MILIDWSKFFSEHMRIHTVTPHKFAHVAHEITVHDYTRRPACARANNILYCALYWFSLVLRIANWLVKSHPLWIVPAGHLCNYDI